MKLDHAQSKEFVAFVDFLQKSPEQKLSKVVLARYKEAGLVAVDDEEKISITKRGRNFAQKVRQAS